MLPILRAALPTAGNFDVELVVVSPDSSRDMLPYAEQLKAKALESGLFLMAEKDIQIDLPQGQFLLDRERIADLGMIWRM